MNIFESERLASTAFIVFVGVGNQGGSTQLLPGSPGLRLLRLSSRNLRS